MRATDARRQLDLVSVALEHEDAGERRRRALRQHHVDARAGAERVLARLQPGEAGDAQPAAVGLEPGLALVPPLLDRWPGRLRPPPRPLARPRSSAARSAVGHRRSHSAPALQGPKVMRKARRSGLSSGPPERAAGAPQEAKTLGRRDPARAQLPEAPDRDREPDQRRLQHPDDPGGPAGRDGRPGHRRARDDLRARHQEPGAVLARSRRARRCARSACRRTSARSPASPRSRARAPTSRTPTTPPSSQKLHPSLRFDRAGTRPPASGPCRSSRRRSCSTSSCSACSSSSTSAGGGAFSPKDVEAAEELGKILGIAFYNQHRAARTNKPSKFGALVDKGLVSEKDVEKAISAARVNQLDVAKILIEEMHVAKGEVLQALGQFYACGAWEGAGHDPGGAEAARLTPTS